MSGTKSSAAALTWRSTLALGFLLLATGARAYSSGTRKKTLESNQIHAYGFNAGLCNANYTISCTFPCYASIMDINQLQAFSDRLYQPLPGRLCGSGNGDSGDDSSGGGALLHCSDSVELDPQLNCGNFQAYSIVIYFNGTAADGSYLENEYDLEFDSEPCNEEECPNPVATS